MVTGRVLVVDLLRTSTVGEGVYTVSGGIYTAVVGVGFYTVDFGNGI